MVQKNWIGKPLGILSIFIIVLISGCDTLTGKEQEPTLQPIIVPVVSDITIVAEGVVVPVNSAELSFAENGIVEEVLVAKGGEIKIGAGHCQDQRTGKNAGGYSGRPN